MGTGNCWWAADTRLSHPKGAPGISAPASIVSIISGEARSASAMTNQYPARVLSDVGGGCAERGGGILSGQWGAEAAGEPSKTILETRFGSCERKNAVNHDQRFAFSSLENPQLQGLSQRDVERPAVDIARLEEASFSRFIAVNFRT